jgi:hypothetical protein
MHQFPVNRDKLSILDGPRLGQGVSYAKAQPHCIGSDDMHDLSFLRSFGLLTL